MKKIVLGMSGGVDSSVSAYILKNAGFEVVGVSIWMNEYNNFEDAKNVAENLGIEFHVIDVRKSFQKNVIDYFCNSYLIGETPNPCVTCNSTVKFKTLFDFADEIGADYVATGHYANVQNQFQDNAVISVANCTKKDQSYFLYGLSHDYLKRIIFPLGKFKSKDDVKEISKNFSFVLATKKESQDICFLKTDYKDFLHHEFDDEDHDGKNNSCSNCHNSSQCSMKPCKNNKILYETSKKGGFIKNLNGEILKKHDGIFKYTIGQRKGLGISFSEPLFVVDINPESNDVIVGTKNDLKTKFFKVRNINFQFQKNHEIVKNFQNMLSLIEKSPSLMQDGISYDKVLEEIFVKVRYASNFKPCTLYLSKDFKTGLVELSDFDFGISKGQSAVFYLNNCVICGGVIS